MEKPKISCSRIQLDNAINGVVKGIFAATRQTCLVGSPVFIHEDIEEEFVGRFTDRAADVEISNTMDPEQDGFGCVQRPVRGSHGVHRTQSKGGVTLQFCGNHPEYFPGECFLEPTILVDVENAMTVAQEAIFLPVASVLTFSSEEEVFTLSNDFEFGLVADIWTEDMRRAHRIASELEAGTIWINEHRTLAYDSPFGGYKDSGFGRENRKRDSKNIYK